MVNSVHERDFPHLKGLYIKKRCLKSITAHVLVSLMIGFVEIIIKQGRRVSKPPVVRMQNAMFCYNFLITIKFTCRRGKATFYHEFFPIGLLE